MYPQSQLRKKLKNKKKKSLQDLSGYEKYNGDIYGQWSMKRVIQESQYRI